MPNKEMVSDTVVASLIGVVGGLIGTSTVGIIGYLAKRKLKKIENDIENLKIDRVKEHQVVIEWLEEITKELQRSNDYDITMPDEIQKRIDTDDG